MYGRDENHFLHSRTASQIFFFFFSASSILTSGPLCFCHPILLNISFQHQLSTTVIFSVFSVLGVGGLAGVGGLVGVGGLAGV